VAGKDFDAPLALDWRADVAEERSEAATSFGCGGGAMSFGSRAHSSGDTGSEAKVFVRCDGGLAEHSPSLVEEDVAD
jgi:hypothetical protein